MTDHAVARGCRVRHPRWGLGRVLCSDWQNVDEWVIQWDIGIAPFHYLTEDFNHTCKADPMTDELRVEISSYTVSRLPDDCLDQYVWAVRVEAAGRGRWAVRNIGSCLNKSGEWEWEPSPSNRDGDWLDTVRWDNAEDAIEAAKAAEPFIVVNGYTSADVLARHNERHP